MELAGIGPGPFAAMMLADAGADVVRVDRTTDVRPHPAGPHPDVVLRGRRSVAVDLKHPDGRQVVLDLAAGSDALLEGFRPGVTERLGLGPADCHAVNPALVYGRMTGWGQDGPLATVAGHDIGYIAVTGALNGVPPGRRPPGAADEPARRHGRRRHDARLRGGLRAARGRPAPGRARWSTRRSWTARRRWPTSSSAGATPAAGRRRPGTTCSTPAPRSTRSTPAPTARRSRSARWSRSSTPSCCDCPGWTVSGAVAPDRRLGPGRLAGGQAALGRAVRDPHPGRVGRGVRGQRRLRGPGAGLGRGGRAPAPGRPRDVPVGGRGGAVRTGPAVRPDPVHTGPAAAAGRAPTPTRCWPSSAAPRTTSPPSRAGAAPVA